RPPNQPVLSPSVSPADATMAGAFGMSDIGASEFQIRPSCGEPSQPVQRGTQAPTRVANPRSHTSYSGLFGGVPEGWCVSASASSLALRSSKVCLSMLLTSLAPRYSTEGRSLRRHVHGRSDAS